MVKLGMRPLLIQTSAIPGEEDPALQTILKQCDPYVTKTANIAPLQYVYDVLQPHLYLGHEYAERLRKKKIEIAHTDVLSPMLGLEVTIAGVQQLIDASTAARQLREGRAAV